MNSSMPLTFVMITTVITMVTANTLRPTVQSNDENEDYGDYGNNQLLVHLIGQIRDDIQEEREARIRENVEQATLIHILESTVAELTSKNTELESRMDQLTSDYNQNTRQQFEIMDNLKELESRMVNSIAHVTTKNEELMRSNTELELRINELASDYNQSTKLQTEVMENLKEELRNTTDELESLINACKNTNGVEEILLPL